MNHQPTNKKYVYNRPNTQNQHFDEHHIALVQLKTKIKTKYMCVCK